MIASALVAITIAGAGLVWWSQRPPAGPWGLSRAEVAAMRFGQQVVRPAGVGTDPCGLARNDALDAVEEGRQDAVVVDVDPGEAGLDEPLALRIEGRDGEAVEVRVGRQAPVGGRTYVRRGETTWAVAGDLREALDAVAARCGEGG